MAPPPESSTSENNGVFGGQETNVHMTLKK